MLNKCFLPEGKHVPVICLSDRVLLLVVLSLTVTLASIRHHAGSEHRHHHYYERTAHSPQSVRLVQSYELHKYFESDNLPNKSVHFRLYYTDENRHFSHFKNDVLTPYLTPKAASFVQTGYPHSDALIDVGTGPTGSVVNDVITWPVKREAVLEGDLILGGLMMVHEREDSVTCGPIMPQGGIQALETMLYTLDVINSQGLLPFTLGAHVLDDCDKDTYGLEMAVDFIKGM